MFLQNIFYLRIFYPSTRHSKLVIGNFFVDKIYVNLIILKIFITIVHR